MEEIWKDIAGYEGLYQVSNEGNVRTTKRQGSKGGLLKISVSDKYAVNYCYVRLCKNGMNKSFWIHRLVAQAFIPNPDGLPQVNHKDQNPSNNMVDNLEWCTLEYNNNYGTVRERQKDTSLKKGIWYTDYSYLLKSDRKEYQRRYYLEHREEILERQKRQKKLKNSGKGKERDSQE